MIRRVLFASATGLALLTAAPAFAQDDGEEGSYSEDSGDAIALDGLPPELAMLANLFGTAEPLTAEQEARLPAADAVVASLVPEGTFVKLISSTTAPLMEKMLTSFGTPPISVVTRQTGLMRSELSELDPEAIAQAVEILDPAADDRQKQMGELVLGVMTKTTERVEPAFRSGMARAYALRFSESELADLAAYFRTPVGAKFAAEAVPILGDPQVMSSMNAMVPALFESLPEVFMQMGAIDKEFPQAKTPSSLTPAERNQLAKLLGVTVQQLEEAEAGRYDEYAEEGEVEAEAAEEGW